MPFCLCKKEASGSPWITTEYLAIARDRDYYKRKFNELNKNSTDNRPIGDLWEKYKQLRNKAINLN